MRNSLENPIFAFIGEKESLWLEKVFEKEEVRDVVFKMSGDKAPRSYGFLIFFFQRFWPDLNEEIMAFKREFHAKGRLSTVICFCFPPSSKHLSTVHDTHYLSITTITKPHPNTTSPFPISLSERRRFF